MPLVDIVHRLKLVELELKKVKDSLTDNPAASFEEYLKRVYRYQGLLEAQKLFTQRSAAEDGEN